MGVHSFQLRGIIVFFRNGVLLIIKQHMTPPIKENKNIPATIEIVFKDKIVGSNSFNATVFANAKNARCVKYKDREFLPHHFKNEKLRNSFVVIKNKNAEMIIRS